MKKWLKTIVPILALTFILLIPGMQTQAGNLTSLTVTAVTGGITVSGVAENDVLSVAIFVYDSTGTDLVAMESVAVDSSHNYTHTFTVSDGTYVIKAADYNGGPWQTKTYTPKAEHASVPELVVYHELKDTDNSGTADVADHLKKYDNSSTDFSYSIGTIDSGSILAEAPTVAEGKVSYKISGSAQAGNSVTIPVTVSSDRYEDFVLNVKVVAKKMTTEAITVPDDGTSTGSGTVTASVTQDKAAPKTTLANLTISKIKALLTSAEQALVDGGAAADLCFEVQKADATVPAADKAKVTGKVTSAIPGGTVGMYLDLTLSVEIGGTERQVTDTGTQSMQVNVQLPDSLKNTDTTKDRTYYIVRVHEGTATVLTPTFDGTNLIFSTNQFSTYAIVYKDTPKTTGGTSGSSSSGSSSSGSAKSNPTQKVAATTGDSTPVGMYVILLLTSVAVLVYLGRKKLKESK